ncbi:Tetraspanin-4-like [Arapaima gigas]
MKTLEACEQGNHGERGKLDEVTEAKNQTMRQTVPSIFLCLPTLLAFSSPHPNSATEESFSKRTALISQALTTAAKTEWPRLPNTSANSYPLNETTKQHNLNVSKRTVTTPSGYRVSEWSGVTGTVETRGGLAESKPWKDYVETPYTPLGERTTTAQSLDTILAGGTQPHEVTTEKTQRLVVWWDGADTSSSWLNPSAVMDLSPPSDSPECFYGYVSLSRERRGREQRLSLVAPEQSQRSPQPPGDEQRRTESETLWIQPRVTLKDITEFWYANRRTRWDMESSEV